MKGESLSNTSAFNAKLVKVSQDDTKSQVNLAHGDGVQAIPVSATVYQVCVFQLGSPTQELLGHCLHEGPRGAPRVALDLVHAR